MRITPQQARGAQNAERAAGGYQRDGHHGEIEQAPGITEERRAMDVDARCDFHHEHAEDQHVEDSEQLAPAGHQ